MPLLASGGIVASMSSATESHDQTYDPAAEAARLDIPDVVIGQRRLNRARATISLTTPPERPELEAVREAWEDKLFPTTLPGDAPVIELGWPTHGPFVSAPHGTYFDTYLAVAQKLLDENHPRFRQMLTDLDAAGAMLRREIVTDDFLAADPEGRVKTPTDLATLWTSAMDARWQREGGYRCFFSSSGAEAIEAGCKLAFLSAYKRFLQRHGASQFARVQEELGHEMVPYFEADPGMPEQPVYDNYPFHIVGCEGGFHGRTLGALSLTWSKKAHRLGFPHPHQYHHIPFNGDGDALRDLIDMRDIEEILAKKGELRKIVIEQRKIPKDLFAGFAAEPFQGEGGYLPGDPEFFAKVRAVCDETQGLMIVDEVQSIGRTGRLFMTEHLGVEPDVVCTAKSMVIGVTIAPARLADLCHMGWHSNTWGAGRVLDTNFAYQTLDTLLHHKDPAFGGLSYLENETVKGEQLAKGLDALQEQYPDVLVGHRGLGLMRAVLVRHRDAVTRAGWERGLKLLGCGWDGEVAPIRLLLMADTLGREIQEFLRVFGDVLAAVSQQAAAND